MSLSFFRVFQDVLDKLSDVGKKDKLLKFFKLVQDGKFPLNNIAFELFLDIVEYMNKLFSVYFQEMPEIKGKRKGGLTLTLYKKSFRYRLMTTY
jgi:hypothetical protein